MGKIALALRAGLLPAIFAGVLFGIFTWFSNPAVDLIYFIIFGALVGTFIGILLLPLTWFLIGIAERRNKNVK